MIFAAALLRRLAALAGVLILAGAAVSQAFAAAGNATCDATTYGAKADGTTNDTAALQNAVDACASKGGGTVVLKGGTFLTGPLVLKSHITLQVNQGAMLLGTPDRTAYKPMELFRQQAVEPLLRADRAVDIRITGGGIIDGNGQEWWNVLNGRKSRHQLPVVERPRLIVFDHCSGVTMEGVHVRNSASWQIVPYYSKDVNIHNIEVTAPVYGPNTDGIDPFSSEDVHISHVLIDTGDDDVAIKSGQPDSPGPDSPSTDITVTDSTFRHGHGLSIGSEISGGVQNVHVSKVHFEGTGNGIRIKSQRGRGGNIGNFSFSGITMTDVKTPIVVSDFYSGKPKDDKPQPVNRLTPRIHDVKISDLTATGAEAAGVIEGLPESPIVRFSLDNVHITAERGLTISHATVTAHGMVIKAAEGEPVLLGKNGVLRRR